MKGALIHGVLLVVMLVYGYRTWTRDTTQKPNTGAVVLWDKADADLVSIEWSTERKLVRLERRGGGQPFWWGLDTTITKVPKPTPPVPPPTDAPDSGSAAGSAAGSADGSAAGSADGSAAGSADGSAAGSAAPPPPEPEMDETRKTREFPLGDNGDKLVQTYVAGRALRELGTPNEQSKKDYKLDESKTTLTVTFKDGKRSFLVGGSVYGGSDRYAVDQQSGKAFVLSKEMITGLEVGESNLHLKDPRGFDVTKIASVTIDAAGKSKTAVRVTAGDEGKQVKTWGDPATKKPNQTLANFIDNANNLSPREYSATTKVEGLVPVVTLTYKDERGSILGTLALYKHEKVAALPEGTELDPANPPPGEVEYFIMTPRTRVPAIVRKDTAERAEQDIATVFSNTPPSGVNSVDPKGNPFGNTPVKPGGMPSNPGGPGAPPGGDPHGHGADDGHGHGAPRAPGAGVPTPAPAPAKAAPAPTPAPAKAAPAPTPAPAKAAPAPTPAPAKAAPAPTPTAAPAPTPAPTPTPTPTPTP